MAWERLKRVDKLLDRVKERECLPDAERDELIGLILDVLKQGTPEFQVFVINRLIDLTLPGPSSALRERVLRVGREVIAKRKRPRRKSKGKR